MKKLFYILLLAVCSALTILSCTEEDVAPKTENGGANISTGQI
jgi:hypothetical protein